MAAEAIGADLASALRDRTVGIYRAAAEYARERGVIIADTKFEFGELNGQILLIDEVLTPDSSRFWDQATHTPGQEPDPMDKQYVRNAVDAMGWDHAPPPPELSDEVITETQRRYATAVERITGGESSPGWKAD